MLDEPVSPPAARKLIREIVTTGTVTFTDHALRELDKDGISEARALTLLRGGIVEPGEWENGEWRYRVRASGAYLVVAFDSEVELLVVTGWRDRR